MAGLESEQWEALESLSEKELTGEESLSSCTLISPISWSIEKQHLAMLLVGGAKFC